MTFFYPTHQYYNTGTLLLAVRRALYGLRRTQWRVKAGGNSISKITD